MRYFILCLIFSMIIIRANGQGESNMWTFGLNNGLNFNNNPPTFFQSSNLSVEGCASIADAGGALLFYSNGNMVWDATGSVMPNGNGILGNGAYPGATTGSSAQGVAIVKSPDNSNRYYLFTLDALEQITSTYHGYLRYSIIDMNLNGGIGDVVPGQKNIVLDSFMSEKMSVTKGADCYYWLLAHRRDGPAYKAFKIDATGIAPAISSNGTWQGSLSGGQLKVSFNGTRIANSTEYGVEIGTFNNATGIVSNTITIDSMPGNGHFGASFSPDDQKLYIGTSNEIAQYDLSAYPNAAAIYASKVVLAPAPPFHAFGQFRNGPDGKIYIGFFQNYPYLGVVSNPNNSGIACNLNTNALLQPSWALGTTSFSLGLGNDVVVSAMVQPDTVSNNITDTVLCNTAFFEANGPAGCNSYLWNDGNTNASRMLAGNGTYWVYGRQSCGVLIDTFKIKFIQLDVDLGSDTAICPGDSLLLYAGQPEASYRWQDNSVNATFKVTNSGQYFVTVTKDACSSTDTIMIAYLDPSLKIPEEDTTICAGESLTLHAVTEVASMYAWNTGSTQPQIEVDKAGTFTVTATNVCGIYIDSVTINTVDCDCRSFVPNVFSPNGDGKNDLFMVRLSCLTSFFKLDIYNRYGQRIFQGDSQAATWNGNYNGKPADTGTYFYYLQYKNARGETIKRKGDIVLIR